MRYRYPPAKQIDAHSKSRLTVGPIYYIRGEVALPGELYSVAEQGLRFAEFKLARAVKSQMTNN